MTKSKLLLTSLILTAFTATGFAADPKPPIKATEKPKILKPCKEGETKDCRVVKKVEKKKKEEKKKPAKKQEKKEVKK